MREKYEINKKVGARIKEARKAAGLTLAELGARVGISESNMQRYESGYITSVSIDKIRKISNALNVAPSFLMCWDNEIYNAISNLNAVVIPKEMIEDPNIIELVESAKGLSSESIKKACEFLRFLRTQEKEKG